MQGELSHLVAACVRIGYHPLVWRRAIAVALRKPRKDDYSKLRSWRLIVLEEVLGKLVEAIEAKRFAWLAVAHVLLPRGQFGGVARQIVACLCACAVLLVCIFLAIAVFLRSSLRGCVAGTLFLPPPPPLAL